MAEPHPDLRAGPPSRWRVIERDRRLVVVEAGAPARSDAPILAEGRWFPQRMRFDGSAAVTTRAWYDAAAPRTIRLDPGAARMVRIATWLGLAVIAGLVALMVAEPLSIIPIGIVLGQAGKPARVAATRWLDTVARGGS